MQRSQLTMLMIGGKILCRLERFLGLDREFIESHDGPLLLVAQNKNKSRATCVFDSKTWGYRLDCPIGRSARRSDGGGGREGQKRACQRAETQRPTLAFSQLFTNTNIRRCGHQ